MFYQIPVRETEAGLGQTFSHGQRRFKIRLNENSKYDTISKIKNTFNKYDNVPIINLASGWC